MVGDGVRLAGADCSAYGIRLRANAESHVASAGFGCSAKSTSPSRREREQLWIVLPVKRDEINVGKEQLKDVARRKRIGEYHLPSNPLRLFDW